MKIRITMADGHILDGLFFSKGVYTLAIKVDKNDANESCAAELVEGEFPWLKSIDSNFDHWFIIVDKSHVVNISVLKN